MSIYKHNYRAYTGALTPLWSRVFVLARYALGETWSSKITVGLFTFSLLPLVIYLVGIYLANNPLAAALFLKGSKGVLAIDAAYFLKMLEGQCWLALVITAWVAPRLITFDGIVAWIGPKSGSLGQNPERLQPRCRTSTTPHVATTSPR